MRRKRRDDEDELNDEKQSTADRYKKAIYFTFSEILECKIISPKLSIFIIVFSFLQQIALTANSSNSDLDSSLIGMILPLVGYTLLFPQITNQENLFFNYGFLSIGFGLSVFLFWGMYYVYNSKNQEEVYIRAFKSTLGQMYDIFDKVVFFPMMGVIISNFLCKLTITCYSTPHIILIILSLITFVMMIILETLYVYLFFNFTFKSQDSLSRNPSKINSTLVVFRLISLIAYLILDITDSSKMLQLMLVQIVVSTVFMMDSLQNFTYHTKSVSKANCIMVTTFFWVNCSSFLLIASNITLFKENALIVVGLGAFFFVKLQLNIISFTANSIMIKELIDIDTDVLLDMKVRIYHTLSQNQHYKKSELLLASLLKIHHDKCVDFMCPCQRRNYLYDPKNLSYGDSKIQFHKDDVFVKHFINKIIKDGLKKFKVSQISNLDYLFYQFESLCQYTPLYQQAYLFRKMHGDNIDSSTDFTLFGLQQKIKKYITIKNNKNPVSESLQVENVKEFDRGLRKIRESIRDVSLHFTDLWETLSDQLPDLAKLLQVCNANFQEIKTTQDMFQNLIALNNTSIELKIIMEIYANQIVFDELLALQVQKSIHMRTQLEVGNSISQDIDFLIKKYNIYDDNACVVSLSSRYDTLSQISWCSHNVDSILGVNSQSLKGRSLNDFMPSVFSSFHDSILKHFYNTGQETTINNIMHTWGLDHQGFCFSANVFAKIIPLDNDYEIMSMIHRLNDMDYIITDQDGEISGFGKKFHNLLNIPPKEFLKYRLNIQLIAPKLMSVFKDYFVEFEDSAESKRPIQGLKQLSVLGSDQTSQLKEIKFILFIPQNFKDVMQDHLEKKNELFSAFFNPGEDILKQKAGLDSKILLEFKSIYFNYLQYGLRKINWKKLEMIIKMRATIQTFTFFNGYSMTSIKALKIMHYEIKKPDYDYMQKMKRRQDDIKGFIYEMNKLIDDQKKKKMKSQKEEDDQLKEKDVKMDDGLQEKRKFQYKKRLKNVLNLFARQSSVNAIQPGGIASSKDNNNQPQEKGRNSNQASQPSTPQNRGQQQASFGKSQNQPPPQPQTNEQGEKIDVEVKKVIVGLLKPNNSYVAKVIRQVRMSTFPNKEKEDPKKKLTSSKKKNGTKQIEESSPKSYIKQSSKEEFKKQGSSINQSNTKIPEKSEKKNKKHLLVRKKSIENFPDYDEDLYLPTCAKFRKILINQKIIGKRPRSHFYQKVEELVKRESGLIFDFDEHAKTIPNISVGEIEDDEAEVEEQPRISLQKQLSSSKNFEKQASRQGSIDVNMEQGKDLRNDFRKQNSKLGVPEKKEFGRKSSKLYMTPPASGFNKLRNKMKNGQLMKQLKILKAPPTKIALEGKEQSKDKSESSSEEEVNADELRILLRSEKSMVSDKDERNLLENLERRDIQEEEKAVVQSVNSTNSSINTQNALRLLRVSLQNMKLPFVLILANYLVILMSLSVFSLSISQLITTQASFSDIKDQVGIINVISDYSENTTYFYSMYKDMMLAQNKYYDQNVYNQDWWKSQQQDIFTYSERFFNYTVDDLSQAGSQEIKAQDIRFYLFEPMDVIMLINQQPKKIELDYQKFIRLYMNAVNNTIFYDNGKFDEQAIQKEDLLYFIFSNYEKGIQQNDKNYSTAYSLIKDSIDFLFIRLLSQWALTFFLILICIIIIYPIILQSKIKIHDSLVLFTKISIRDVENYFQHYKNITHYFTTFQNIRQLTRDVESYIDEEMLFHQKQKKENDSRSISRSRHYKGVKIDQMRFFFQMLTVYSFFTLFLILKDIRMVIFINKSDELITYQINQQQVFYEYQKRLISYKEYLMDFYNVEDSTKISQDSNNLQMLLKGNVTELLMENYQQFGEIDPNYSTFIQNLMTAPLCNVLQVTTESNCQNLQNGILQKSYQNFYINAENVFTNGYEHVKGVYFSQGYSQAKKEAYIQMNDQFIKDLTKIQEYIQKANILWRTQEQATLFSEIDEQIMFTQIVVVAYTVAIFLFLTLVWMNVYLKLKRDSRWVNGFILLIPIQMLRENQYLRSYLKRKLQINSLSYA